MNSDKYKSQIKKFDVALIKLALKEDIGSGDITTKALIPADQKIKAVVLIKQSGIIAGLPLIKQIYQLLDKKIKVKLLLKEGAAVKIGQKAAVITGLARPILTGERTALNFLQRLSGIATLTNKFVRKTKEYPVKILDTRKTIPGWRLLDKYAVRIGGGFNHRFGLSDMVLIKDNHLSVSGNNKPAGRHPARFTLATARRVIYALNKANQLRKQKHFKIEIEVKTLSEFRLALPFNPDIIMLDNMKLKDILRAVLLRNRWSLPGPRLEVSGGVNLNNAAKIARTGVDFISVGAITHSAPALDISMETNYAR